MSVVASICTVLLSRNYGYGYAFAVAAGFYTLALVFSFTLGRVGRSVERVGPRHTRAEE
jgi:dipeptide/tripeptide permease